MADVSISTGAAQGRPQSPSAPNPLSLPTVRWLAELPDRVRPSRTAARFPHIVNILSTSWTSPAACRAHFEELLLDSRGDRRGFPPSIMLELAVLKDYYESVVHPTHQTVWDELARRSLAR